MTTKLIPRDPISYLIGDVLNIIKAERKKHDFRILDFTWVNSSNVVDIKLAGGQIFRLEVVVTRGRCKSSFRRDIKSSTHLREFSPNYTLILQQNISLDAAYNKILGVLTNFCCGGRNKDGYNLPRKVIWTNELRLELRRNFESAAA